MRFLDSAKIMVCSGSGGAGAVSFRREKFVEFGGPDGGDGGRGGDVVATASTDLNTLIDFRYRSRYVAADGGRGQGSRKSGARGKDQVIVVPAGTEILDRDLDIVIGDLTCNGQSLLIARGGRGGIGNARLKTSVDRAPRRSIPPESGIQRYLLLRLKTIADVGLVGLPNAGKSTFLACISNARPRVADYPFTTIRPHLGTTTSGGVKFVVADVPGLVEGASTGRGLGHRFLRHLERCNLLVHILDGTRDTMEEDRQIIEGELASYECGLPEKPMLRVINKIDALPQDLREQKLQSIDPACGQVCMISALTGEGVDRCVKLISNSVRMVRPESDDGARRWTP